MKLHRTVQANIHLWIYDSARKPGFPIISLKYQQISQSPNPVVKASATTLAIRIENDAFDTEEALFI